jgi:hypothetical protein
MDEAAQAHVRVGHDAPVNGRLLRVVGLGRSGNHAILNWILRQLDGRWAFLNCVEGKSNPIRTARPTDSGQALFANFSDFDPAAEAAGRPAPKDHLVLSMEDSFLAHAFGPEATRLQDAGVGPSAERLDVVVLRDPYNLFASRLKVPEQVLPPPLALRIWKQHARACLGLGRTRLPNRTLFAGFGRWAADPGYRRLLAAQLGLAFTDAGREEILACAGGSSFDGTAYQGRAGEMAVGERWRRVADDPRLGPAYRALFDVETHALAARCFPGQGMEAIAATLTAGEPRAPERPAAQT